MRLADRQAANGVTRKLEIEELTGALPAQIGKGGALHDAELPLRKLSVAAGALKKIPARAARPACRSSQRGLRRFARRGSLDAFVEHHGDIRTERKLNFCSFLRSQ